MAGNILATLPNSQFFCKCFSFHFSKHIWTRNPEGEDFASWQPKINQLNKLV